MYLLHTIYKYSLNFDFVILYFVTSILNWIIYSLMRMDQAIHTALQPSTKAEHRF